MKTHKHRFKLTAVALLFCSLATHAAEDDFFGKDELFGDDLPKLAAPRQAKGPGLKGFIQFEAARTTPNPDHWSKLRTRAELGSNGKLTDSVKWKASARADVDFAYMLNDYYLSDVERNQRYNLELRETYVDYSAGNWDFRVGKQNVIWGEMVGLFFADVVSARDQREFILPEFDQMRIPQWAARAEYFAGDVHAELLWIPIASYDNIGKPGADFFPYQPTFGFANVRYLPELRPERDADNMNYGVRVSTLAKGWDLSAFYYRSSDISPTFYRQIVGPTLYYQARHDRIHQYGGTVTKDFGDIVFKAESVYTTGRSFTTLDITDPDGVVSQNTVDWAAGLDFTLPADSRFNIQFFQRHFFKHNAGLIPERDENGYSLLFNTKIFANWEVQALLISSLNRSDWLFRPKASWNFEKNWRWILGIDVFNGPQTGLFGRYDQNDRFYTELRYSF